MHRLRVDYASTGHADWGLGVTGTGPSLADLIGTLTHGSCERVDP